MLRILLILISLSLETVAKAQQSFSPEKEALKLFNVYKQQLRNQMMQ